MSRLIIAVGVAFLVSCAGAPEPTGPGNEPSPGPVATEAPAPRLPTWHTIERGETLWGIATNYYGSGSHWRAIQDANPGFDPAKAQPGDRILIPRIEPDGR